MKQRLEASGPGWQERFVEVERAAATPSMATAFSNSLSYIVFPNFASAEERGALQESAMELQQIFLKDGDSDVSIFKGISINWVSEVSRFSVTELLDAKARATSDVLLNRLLSFLEFGEDNNNDANLGNVADLVFGFKSNLQQMKTKWYDEMTYDKVSNPEPMVNIYEEGGYFKRHADGMKMTLLVVLNDAVEGGGTAFYVEPQDEEKDDENNSLPLPEEDDIDDKYDKDNAPNLEPERIENPPAGTAMIWGGALNHSALPVIKGMRSVYVGSFELVRE